MQVRSEKNGRALSYKEVNEYLWFGYNVPERPASFLLDKGPCDESDALIPKNTSTAKALLSEVVGDACNSGISSYLVPISGGWDSRLLLSELCDQVDKRKIRACTFGVPGALDYELALNFARRLGVSIDVIDLSATLVTWSDLVDASKAGQGVPPTLSWPNLAILRDAAKGKEAVFSGFIGDFINGGHDKALDKLPSIDFFERFAMEKQFSSSVRLTDERFFPSRSPLVGMAEPSWLTPNQAMFIWYRVLGFTAPALLGQEMRGFVGSYTNPFDGTSSVFTPFTDERWVRFWMGANQRDRYGQSLFFRMMKEFYPTAYGYPSKDRWGVKREESAKRITRQGLHRMRNYLHRQLPRLPLRSSLMDNYIDFQHAFRKREDYIEIIERAIDVLRQSEAVPWVDLRRIWQEHYRGNRDHAQALQVLVGLAINLDTSG